MTTNGKDTIYIDIDDEITTIIEKVRASNEKIVALVLPKRASVLQSIVNMKLLKRTAEAAKKHLVLITSEAGILPLAGAVGVYVAKTLQTKPEIPATAPMDNDEDASDEVDGPDEESSGDVTARSAGRLAVTSSAGAAADGGIETLQLDDDTELADGDDGSGPKKPKGSKDKKLHIPNFDKFRVRVFLGILALVLLIFGWYVCAAVLPKGSIVITTDTADINSNVTFTADTAAKAVDDTKLVIPAQVQQVQKNGSQQVPTTGKKNNGNKATGSVVVTTQCTKKPASINPGIGLSSGGLTFITTDTLAFGNINVDGNGNFVCSGTVPVISQQGGSQYNLAASSSFTVAGYPGFSGSNGNAFTGGTDDIIQIVTQADIDSAGQKIAAQNTDALKQQLQQQLQQAGLFPLVVTFVAATPAATNSSNVGDQASTVTVTQTTTYTMFGVKQADLKTLVDNDVKKQIDPAKQSILSEGLTKATFRVNGATPTAAQLVLATTATAGPDIKTDTIQKAIAGKKSGEIQTLLKTNPGVTDVKVHLSPFWVTKAPAKAGKVTITFQKAAH